MFKINSRVCFFILLIEYASLLFSPFLLSVYVEFSHVKRQGNMVPAHARMIEIGALENISRCCHGTC
ncbi:hypothetical protein RIF29_40198 [Crotalaria pallida]|uniref:Uncharacterized protein n=1 Tax=Crotalaria pallida TaxID=3830 RepID=A0AAN9HU47_CROPI